MLHNFIYLYVCMYVCRSLPSEPLFVFAPEYGAPMLNYFGKIRRQFARTFFMLLFALTLSIVGLLLSLLDVGLTISILTLMLLDLSCLL